MLITLFGAFVAGLVSFLSPCVLPIIPGFLAYLAGAGVAKKSDGTSELVQPSRGEIFLNSVFFVLGFAVVFALLGVLLNTVLQSASYMVQEWLARIGGLIVIFFGLFLTGLIHIPFLEREHKIGVKKKFNSRYVTSFLFGLAFAAGWTPCVGSALGAIIGLAASAPSEAFILFLIYALGLGIPFLIVGLFTSQATVFISRYSNALKYLNIIFGIILIMLGVLVFTESLPLIGNILPVQFIVNKI
jgi:cytochrome c-type biogenesis protein